MKKISANQWWINRVQVYRLWRSRLGGWNIAVSMLAVAVGHANVALAQSDSGDNRSRSSDSAGQVAEIIVTANKREQNLQAVPVAVSAFTSDKLNSAGVTDTTTLQRLTPSLVFAKLNNQTAPSIRGVTTYTPTSGNENAVALYVDGVYISSSGSSAFSFNNIERIEVLKGPQGTLFGRNAAGGVIQVITRTPGSNATVDASFGLENYDTKEARFYGSTPLVDNGDMLVAVDTAIYWRDQSDGWGRNTFDGSKTFWRNEFAARSKLLLESERTKLTISGDYYRVKRNGTGLKTPAGLPEVTGAINDDALYDISVDYSPKVGSAEQYGLSARFDHDLGWARLVNIAAWRRERGESTQDADKTILPIFHLRVVDETETITDEFQLLSPSSSAISWVAGLFYMNQVSGSVPFSYTGLSVAPLSEVALYSRQETNSYAVFGQATVPLGDDRTNLTGGIRYSYDKRDFSGYINGTADTPGGPVIIPVVPVDTGTADAGKVTYKVAIDHKLSDDIMVYASVSTGFKSGLFNNSAIGDPPVEPQTTTAYEIGFKSELFDRRLRLNASAFYYDMKNLQVNSIDSSGFVRTLNAASARSKGVELDFEASLGHGIRLSGGVAYLDAKYKSFENPPWVNLDPTTAFVDVARVGAGEAADGMRLPFAPKWTINVGPEYSFAVDDFDVTLAANYYYNSGYVGSNPVPVPGLTVKSFSLTSANMKIGPASGAWFARAWVNNLFDKRYYDNISITGGLGSLSSPAAPRTYGVTFGVSFQ